MSNPGSSVGRNLKTGARQLSAQMLQDGAALMKGSDKEQLAEGIHAL